jgi:ElaA protein
VTALRVAAFTELHAATLYDLLQLRVDVFVVEQACPYPELDGRDTEPEARHCWIEDRGRVVAYLRLLPEPEGATRVGRLATARDRRGEGLAARLLDHALGLAGRPVVADVQSHLVGWYARFGFTADGPEFVMDGIPHVPMRLA